MWEILCKMFLVLVTNLFLKLLPSFQTTWVVSDTTTWLFLHAVTSPRVSAFIVKLLLNKAFFTDISKYIAKYFQYLQQVFYQISSLRSQLSISVKKILPCWWMTPSVQCKRLHCRLILTFDIQSACNSCWSYWFQHERNSVTQWTWGS